MQNLIELQKSEKINLIKEWFKYIKVKFVKFDNENNIAISSQIFKQKAKRLNEINFQVVAECLYYTVYETSFYKCSETGKIYVDCVNTHSFKEFEKNEMDKYLLPFDDKTFGYLIPKN